MKRNRTEKNINICKELLRRLIDYMVLPRFLIAPGLKNKYYVLRNIKATNYIINSHRHSKYIDKGKQFVLRIASNSLKLLPLINTECERSELHVHVYTTETTERSQ